MNLHCIFFPHKYIHIGSFVKGIGDDGNLQLGGIYQCIFCKKICISSGVDNDNTSTPIIFEEKTQNKKELLNIPNVEDMS